MYVTEQITEDDNGELIPCTDLTRHLYHARIIFLSRSFVGLNCVDANIHL